MLYVAPVVAALRLAVPPPFETPLPALTVPRLAVPLLRVPKLHRLAPLPAVQHVRPPAAVVAPVRPVAHHRVRVPVVTDVHVQVAPAATRRAKPTRDPFAGAPVVSDTIGAPAELPAPTAAPIDATPVDAPAADAARAPPGSDVSDSAEPARSAHGLQWFDDPAPPPADAPPADTPPSDAPPADAPPADTTPPADATPPADTPPRADTTPSGTPAPPSDLIASL